MTAMPKVQNVSTATAARQLASRALITSMEADAFHKAGQSHFALLAADRAERLINAASFPPVEGGDPLIEGEDLVLIEKARNTGRRIIAEIRRGSK